MPLLLHSFVFRGSTGQQKAPTQPKRLMSDDSLAAQVVHGIDRQITNSTTGREESVATQTSRQWYTTAQHVDETYHATDKILDWMSVESRRQGSRMIHRQGSRNKVGVLRQGRRRHPADQHRAATRTIIRNLGLNARQLNTSTVSALIGTRIPEEIVVNDNHKAMRTQTVPYAGGTIQMLLKHAICCATQRQHR